MRTLSRRASLASFVPGPVRVRVPATWANLGPGFDSAGLCLALHDEVEVAVAPRGQLQLVVRGEGSETLPRQGRRHLVVSSIYRALDLLGGRPPGLAVTCTNRIPQSRGLGSSSAAIVAGVLAARALVEDGPDRFDDAAVLALANRIEGHPDNVAACLRGGFTLAWQDEAGVHVVRRDACADLLPVALVPPTRSSTKEVRGLLPAGCRTPTPPRTPRGPACSPSPSPATCPCCCRRPSTGCTSRTAPPRCAAVPLSCNGCAPTGCPPSSAGPDPRSSR